MIDITYYGHSCFGIQIDGTHVLIDPFISPNPLSKHIDISQIKADFIFLTHGHADHVADVARIATPDTPIIATFEVATWFGKKGLNGQGLNHGGVWQGPFGQVRVVNAIHSSSMPDGSYGGAPCGFVFMTKEINFYISGDTALTLDMQLIPTLCGKIDLAILCVGGHFTMGAEDAVKACEMVGCEKAIGCHFDTFPSITIDHAQSIELFKKAGKQLILPEIGQKHTF
jgi:L-ascorbate metabolism protein UlaG (beta-lactamase superfamily)